MGPDAGGGVGVIGQAGSAGLGEGVAVVAQVVRLAGVSHAEVAVHPD